MRAAVPLVLASLSASAAAAGSPPAKPSPAQCTPTVQASPDRNGLNLSPARTVRMVAETRDHFIAAARAACAGGIIAPRDLAHFRRLLLRDAEGTTEPMLFTREAGPTAAYLDFAYQSGPAPTVGALRNALRCWKRPSARGCEIGD